MATAARLAENEIATHPSPILARCDHCRPCFIGCDRVPAHARAEPSFQVASGCGCLLEPGRPYRFGPLDSVCPRGTRNNLLEISFHRLRHGLAGLWTSLHRALLYTRLQGSCVLPWKYSHGDCRLLRCLCLGADLRSDSGHSVLLAVDRLQLWPLCALPGLANRQAESGASSLTL